MLSLSLLPWARRSGSSSETGQARSGSGSNTTEAEPLDIPTSGPTLSASGSSNLPAVASLPETRRLVVQTALDHLFKSNHFSICQLDAVLKVMDQPQGTPAYQMLRALHCVDYAAMPSELLQRIPQLVNECLRPPEPEPHIATAVALQGVDL